MQETNRLETLKKKEVLGSIKSHIEWIEKEIKRLDEAIKALREISVEIKAQHELLTSIKGIGAVVSDVLIA